MSQTSTVHPGPSAVLWTLAGASLLLASAALAVVLWEPRALWIGLFAGLLALVSWGLFARVRARLRARAGASAALADAGLILGALVVLPLLGFAVLWIGLLLILGLTWLLHLVGLA